VVKVIIEAVVALEKWTNCLICKNNQNLILASLQAIFIMKNHSWQIHDFGRNCLFLLNKQSASSKAPGSGISDLVCAMGYNKIRRQAP
jgi:hypothetical protein